MIQPISTKRSTAVTNGAKKSRSACSGAGRDLQTLEELEPVLHTGEGPLAFRSNLAIAPDQARALVGELL